MTDSTRYIIISLYIAQHTHILITVQVKQFWKRYSGPEEDAEESELIYI